jgi:hypothetical protein
MDIHGYWVCIRIRIHEILRLRIYPWILLMKKSGIHIRVSMESPIFLFQEGLQLRVDVFLCI